MLINRNHHDDRPRSLQGIEYQGKSHGQVRESRPQYRSRQDRSGSAEIKLSWLSKWIVTMGVSLALVVPAFPAAANGHSGTPRVSELASYVEGPCADDVCGSGSAVGPDGALYVTDSTAGRIKRINPWRGTVTTYADGLPPQIPGAGGGGVADVAFLGRTAYVLVTGVSQFWTELVGSSNAPAAEGVYRLDRDDNGKTRATLIADIYTWSEDHPPVNQDIIFVPGGYTYAMQPYRDGFLVTDGHHNRVLRVRTNGEISVFKDFAQNVVPTGLERVGHVVLVGQAGPVPHTPETGRVVALRGAGGRAAPLASGAPLLVDVEVGPQHRMYGLSQGDWPYEGQEGKEGFPAAPNTGHLMRADRHGQFRTVVSKLDRPTTLEFIDGTAFVVTISGKVLRISGLGR